MQDNCSRHSKQVGGISDMKILAEAIGDLHYETLAELFGHLENKLLADGERDYKAGKKKLGKVLCEAGFAIESAKVFIKQSWEISKPYMNKTTER